VREQSPGSRAGGRPFARPSRPPASPQAPSRRDGEPAGPRSSLSSVDSDPYTAAMRPDRRILLAQTLLATALVTPATAQIGDRAVRLLDAAIARTTASLGKTDIWQDHSTWDKAWVVRSDGGHYEVRTTHSHALGRSVANGLETMLGHFQATFGVRQTPLEPFEILIFPDIAGYNGFGDEYGDERSSFYGAFYARNHPNGAVGAVYNANHTYLKMQLTNAAANQWGSLWGSRALGATSDPPVWVQAGIGGYFELFWSHAWAVQQFERWRDEQRLLPLDELLSAPWSAYSDKTQIRMIELGLLFEYLLIHREDTRTVNEDNAPFRDLLLAVVRGDPVPPELAYLVPSSNAQTNAASNGSGFFDRLRDAAAALQKARDQATSGEDPLEALQRDFFAFQFPK
jgi:hypothetical protein